MPRLGTAVVESTNAPGTGDVLLLGALPGRVAFASVFGDTDQVEYYIGDASQTEWGIGTLHLESPPRLSRDTVVGNSYGSTAAVTFSGAALVYHEPLARHMVLAALDNLTVPMGGRRVTQLAAAAAATDAVRQQEFTLVAAGLEETETVLANTQAALGETARDAFHTNGDRQATGNFNLGGYQITNIGLAWVGGLARCETGNTNNGSAFYADGQALGVAHFSASQTTGVAVRMRIQGSGLVDSVAACQFLYNNQYCGEVAINNGGFGVQYRTNSDHRLKQDVRPIERALAAVRAVPAVRYAFRGDPGRELHGFLAHELQMVAPEAVSGTKDQVDADGQPVLQGVDHGRVTPLLWAALTELADQVAGLQARLAALEARPAA